MFNMLGAVAQFERDIINERTKEGRERAKRQGKHMGRKGQPAAKVREALQLFEQRKEKGLSVNDIVKLTDVPRATIYTKAKEHGLT
jgi:DNA invertase Pin-like site-specific DNA recombinase